MVELLAKHDVLALPFPEAFGGLGGDLLTLCVAIEELSRACATSGLILAVQELGSLPILLAGTDEQKQRWIPDLAAGKNLIAFAITESEAGSDAAATRTKATRAADTWRIDGSKRFISQGSVATLVAVFAVTDPSPEALKAYRHMTCFYVEQGMAGFGVGKLEHKMGIRGSPTAELTFDGVSVPDVNRIGEVGEGWSIAMRTFERSRPGIAAQAVGIAQGALEVAAKYSRRTEAVRPAGGGLPDGGRPARRHGHADRGRASVALHRVRGDPGRRHGNVGYLASALVRDGQAVLWRHCDARHDRRRPGSGWLRLHRGLPNRADDA